MDNTTFAKNCVNAITECIVYDWSDEFRNEYWEEIKDGTNIYYHMSSVKPMQIRKAINKWISNMPPSSARTLGDIYLDVFDYLVGVAQSKTWENKFADYKEKYGETLRSLDLAAIPEETLFNFGFVSWSSNLVLMPIWFASILPDDYLVTSIFGNQKKIGTMNNDVRCGCIAAGFVKN